MEVSASATILGGGGKVKTFQCKNRRGPKNGSGDRATRKMLCYPKSRKNRHTRRAPKSLQERSHKHQDNVEDAFIPILNMIFGTVYADDRLRTNRGDGAHSRVGKQNEPVALGDEATPRQRLTSRDFHRMRSRLRAVSSRRAVSHAKSDAAADAGRARAEHNWHVFPRASASRPSR